MQQPGPVRAIALAPLPTELVGQVQVPATAFYTVPAGYYPAAPFVTTMAQPSGRSGGTRSGVCASRHMAAEQRRRARINERLDALRGLVPHSARANTAAFLTEVFDYINNLHKQLERMAGSSADLNVKAYVPKYSFPHEFAGRAGSEHGGHVPYTPSPVQSISAPKRSREDYDQSELEGESEGQGGTSTWNDAEAVEVEGEQVRVYAPSLFDSTKETGTSSSSRSLSPSLGGMSDVLSLRMCGGMEVRSAFSPPSLPSSNPKAPGAFTAVQARESCENLINLGFGQADSSRSPTPRQTVVLQENAWSMVSGGTNQLPAKKRHRFGASPDAPNINTRLGHTQGVHRPIALKPAAC